MTTTPTPTNCPNCGAEPYADENGPKFMFLRAPLWRCGSVDGWITEACLRRQIAQLKAQNERLREVFLKCRKAIMMDPRMKTQERARETLDFLAEGTTAHLCRAVLETEELAKEVEA